MSRCAAALAVLDVCVGFLPQQDPWFDQFPATDGYLASDGHVNRLPLRLTSHETILYGEADYDAVMKSFEAEDFVPVTVSNDKVGKVVPLQIWFNNFTDTDCGDAGVRNPYLETWYSLPVVPRDSPLDLPYKTSMDLMVVEGLVWVHRVICGDTPGHKGPAMAAISGGREVFGYPKHPVLADIDYEYEGADFVSFKAHHLGLPAVDLRMKLPETLPEEQVTVLPLDAATPADGCVSGPRWLVKQTRYGQAFKCTEYIAEWDESTDSLSVGSDLHYGVLLQSFNFQPKLKVHSTDFKIVAMKPSGWVGAPNQSMIV